MRLVIIAGEISGDLHAARLLTAIRSRCPDVESSGIGGEALQKAGMHLIIHCQEMAVMGIVEVLRRYLPLRRAFYRLLDHIKSDPPDAVIFVDYPGFNLRLARKLTTVATKKIYYICPQVWAWNTSRIPLMASLLDRLIVIFPFEPDVFKDTRLPVDYVGHPLVAESQAVLDAPLETLSWGDTPGIAILPGSRSQEISRMLPVMARAAAIVARQSPGTRFILAAANGSAAHQARTILSEKTRDVPAIDVVTGRTRQILKQARAAWVTSGTATLEAALMECPMVIGYRMAPLTYLMGRILVRVDHIGMVNIIAGRRLCPELVQSQMTAEALAGAIKPLIAETETRSATISGLKQVRADLGEPGAEERAAEIICRELGLQGLRTYPPPSA